MKNEKELMAVELTDAELETVDGGSGTTSYNGDWVRTRDNGKGDSSKYNLGFSINDGPNGTVRDVHGSFDVNWGI